MCTAHEFVIGEVMLTEMRRTLASKFKLPGDGTDAIEAVLTTVPIVPKPPAPSELVVRDAAVTRRTLDHKNPGGWVPAQKISVEDALRAYTTGGAYAMFDETSKGSIEPGKLADFVLIDREITRMAPEAIRTARVMMTFVGGVPMYQRSSP